MFSRNPHLRFLRPVALTSLLLLGLCVFTAFALLQEQAGTTESLAENIASRREAADLRESLIDLVGLLRDPRSGSLDSLHQRIGKHLDVIRRHADKPAERELAELVGRSYGNYVKFYRAVPESGSGHTEGLREAAALLDPDTLNLCQDLVDYNTHQIERSEEEHRRSLRRLAWGMGAVGVTGAVAGLVLGYGVALGLSRRIRRLQIGLQDAAGKLGPDLPEIVLTGQGDLTGLEGQVQELMGRVEQVVGKLQQREREVLRAEQLAAVGQLAAGVAHEIRNPLTSIKMLVQAGREDGRLPADDLAVVEEEIRRMERSLQVFLDFARLPKPERRPQDLAEIGGRTLDLVRGRAAKQGVEVRLSAPAGPVRVEADGDQVQQVLVNLCLNALDAMPSGGTLELRVTPAAGGAEAAVLDTGPGVAPELMPRLFGPFVSTKETGVGLGLVISRRIAEEHGGTLTAANRPRSGACFTLTLPAAPKEAA